MPIYEYRCSACGFEKDALQKMSDPPLLECPSCGKPALVKLVSAAGFQLKGSGWYATDFKNSGSKPAAKTPVEAGDKGTSKSDGKDSSSAKPDKTESGAAKPDGNTQPKSAAA